MLLGVGDLAPLAGNGYPVTRPPPPTVCSPHFEATQPSGNLYTSVAHRALACAAYEKGRKPRPLVDEPKLGFPPIQIQVNQREDRLLSESRINYSKLITVEHNVKVRFIGSVVPGEYDLVRVAANKCWEEKIHHVRYRKYR